MSRFDNFNALCAMNTGKLEEFKKGLEFLSFNELYLLINYLGTQADAAYHSNRAIEGLDCVERIKIANEEMRLRFLYSVS